MTTASKAFKEYLHTRTKPVSVFDVSQLPEPYRSRYELYLEATRLNLVRYIETHRLDVDPERVHVGFVAHPRLNAWAVEPNGFHFIGINAALPCLVDRLWNMVLARTPALPSIGRAPTKIDPVWSLPPNPSWVSEEEDVGSEELVEDILDACEFGVPEDEDRARFAAEMASLTTMFALFHESGHLLAGHSARMNELGLQDGVVELDDGGTGQRVPDDRHAWELIADHYAFETLMLRLNSTELLKGSSPLASRWWREANAADVPMKNEAEIAVVTAAMSALFLLFVAGETGATPTHPHPFVRLSFLVLQERHVLPTSAGPEGRIVSDMAWAALSQVWAGFRMLGMPTLVTPEFPKVRSTLKALEVRVLQSRKDLKHLSWDARQRPTSELGSSAVMPP